VNDDLDRRVIQALRYLRALIKAGRHDPSPEARRALRGVQTSIDDLDRHGGRTRGGTWH
jgi:hypothetical protein